MSHCPRILVVDPDPAVLRRLGADAARLTGSDGALAEVLPAGDLATAVARLGSEPVDAVVCDMGLSEDDATELVGEVERQYPGLVVIATAERANESDVARACHLGAAGLVVKPYGLSQIVAMLDAPATDAGFSGTCAGVPTALLLTLHCHNGGDGVLHLYCPSTSTRPERRGSVHVSGGQPVHATTGALVGAEAVHAMLGWPDAEATWLPGSTHCARTIVGRWEGLVARAAATDDPTQAPEAVAVAYPEVIEKLSRLAQTPDVLGAFLLRHAETVAGRCVPGIDPQLAARSLRRLAHVYHDVEAQPASEEGHEIQAIVGGMRLVLDRVGPPEVGYQVGVLVRQAAPVCKSLRRLLRQIDRAFIRADKARARKLAKAARTGTDPRRDDVAA